MVTTKLFVSVGSRQTGGNHRGVTSTDVANVRCRVEFSRPSQWSALFERVLGFIGADHGQFSFFPRLVFWVSLLGMVSAVLSHADVKVVNSEASHSSARNVEPYAFAEPNLIPVVARSKAGGARSTSNAHCQTLYELFGAAKDIRHADNLSVMAWRWCSTGLTKMLNFSSSCRRIRTRCVRCNVWMWHRRV